MKLDELAQQSGEWLSGKGPESDIVISSRIRLARNIAGFPFIRKCSPKDRANITTEVHDALSGLPISKDVEYVDVAKLGELDRQFLMERQLISHELSEAQGARAVILDPKERFSIMINEEDHLRFQVMQSGLDLESAWNRMDELDNVLEEKLTYSYTTKLGYLTACPTNVGTGLRVSVMLHLPALVATKQIDKVFRALNKINVAVRGLFGEGSQFMGDFYQISNQTTLGRSEVSLMERVKEVVPRIIDYERRAREFLVEQSKEDLSDNVSRALGILCTAKKISSEETMHYLSKVRMGVNLGLLNDIKIPILNKLFIQTQPAHLQKLRGHKLSVADRNIERAIYLQQHLRNPSGENN
ncbi:MAG: protein arginine kinase [Pirellula sp.]|nr:protein arginine kinase [Pirellula sp.]